MFTNLPTVDSRSTWALIPRAAHAQLFELALEVAIAAMMLGVVILWEKKSLASVGIRRLSMRDLGAVFALLPIFFVPALMRATGILPFWMRQDQRLLQLLLALPFRVRLLAALVNPIAEEFVFRPFVIERLEELTGSTTFAAGVSVAASALAHIGWGWPGVIVVTPALTTLAVLYVWRRNLFANALSHFFSDAMLIVAPWIASGHFTGPR